MKTTITIQTTYHCTLERAFKSPMLCDVTQVHAGYGAMPRVTHTSDDAGWGQPGGSKRIYMAPTFWFKGGEASLDTVLERIENKYWKIEINHFKFNSMGFSRIVGEWETTELKPNEIQIRYTYNLYSRYLLLYPFNWLIGQTFWRMYMKRVLERVRHLAYTEAPYLYP